MSVRAIGKSETSRALFGCLSVWHFLYAIALLPDWTRKQRYARKGIRYRGIFRVMQISNHYPAKTQAEIQKTVQLVFNMEKVT